MSHARYDIWIEDSTVPVDFPWRVQMTGYIAVFRTQEMADSFVDAVKEYRKKRGLK